MACVRSTHIDLQVLTERHGLPLHDELVIGYANLTPSLFTDTGSMSGWQVGFPLHVDFHGWLPLCSQGL